MSFARAGLAAPRGILGPDGTKEGRGLSPAPLSFATLQLQAPGLKTKAAPPEAREGAERPTLRAKRALPSEDRKGGGSCNTPLHKYESEGQRK